MSTIQQQPLDVGTLASGGWAMFRARPGFYLGLVCVFFGPGYLAMMGAQAFQLDYVVDVYAAMFRGQMPMPMQQSIGATLFTFLGYGLLLVGLIGFQGALVSSAMAQVRGRKLGIVESVQAAGYAPLWMALFEVPYFIALGVGLACCLLPGIFVWFAVAALAPYLNVLIVEERLTLFDALSKSSAMTVGDRGAFVALATLFFGLYLLMTFIMGILMAAIAFALTSGFTVPPDEAAIRTFMLGTFALGLFSMPFTAALWCWLYLARVHAYVRKTGIEAHRSGALANVFA